LIVLGINIVDGLEMFAENFEIETAIAVRDKVITVYDYYEEELPDGLRDLIKSDLSASRAEGYTYSTIVPELKHRVSSIPFSRETRASEVRLLIFDDQAELIEALEQSSFQNQLSFGLVGGAILLVVFFITTVSFNRINSSIVALEKIESGDLEKVDEKEYTLFTSDNDEVSRLQRSIEEYRDHRIEAESQRRERARRRDERDNIMFEKMSALSQQLEGNARDMLVQEITEMKGKLSSGNDEDKEQASIEMMSRAFSKMSEEVSTLIDARTQELVVARDEISSSIRYAAKLQKTLLPKSFPGDIDIEVEWRPRDLVGGDIYFIKDFPDRVYIAVVDCTGHGVPGAFLSILARSHLDKAIREDGNQTAGEYLSEVNALLRATLSRADQSNTSEEGFDGGVCIYRRESRTLEFAGAKASLFNVDGREASEVGGDRKSVGSSRIPDGFEYATHYVKSPTGAFVMLTDGITDVMSPDERPVAFGRRRVLRILRDSKNATPSNIVKEIISSVDLYRGNAPLRDDLTLLAFSLEDPTQVTENLAISGDSKG
jgi:serine phosphatase RsbU (regulator of sigma subunit)